MTVIEKTMQALANRFKTKRENSYERQIKAPAIEETVQHVYKEQIQPVELKEVREVQIKHSVQPIVQRVQKEAEFAEAVLPLEFTEIKHDIVPSDQPVLGSYTVLDDKTDTAYLEPIEKTLVSKHVVEVIQPILRRYTEVPHHFNKIVPSFTRHVHVEESHDAEELPPISEDQWSACLNQYKNNQGVNCSELSLCSPRRP